ncbi:MAG: hypothetical protein H0V48_07490 [Nocardioidaceae bacterium]|nr:hypothetical protein [Nocardioidaceae bacterium]MDQ3164691.1 hypothetical protein [Actinomycetota bacterium]
MGLVSKLAKFTLAKKVYDEARKPENQARIKRAVASVRERSQARSKQPPS